MQIILLDTETTGIDEYAKLVQLAYKNLNTLQMVNEYFKPSCPISYGAMATHHITEEMVADKQSFEGSKTHTELAELLKDNVLVAHNAPFDIRVLKSEGIKVGAFIDTLRVARHLIDAEKYSLQYLRYCLHLNVNARAHDAMGDISVLETLYENLVTAVEKEYSLSTDDECVEKMLELTNTPVLLKTFTFGKYKGQAIEQVSENDRGYLEWLHGSEVQKGPELQNVELVYTLRSHLGLPEY